MCTFNKNKKKKLSANLTNFQEEDDSLEVHRSYDNDTPMGFIRFDQSLVSRKRI